MKKIYSILALALAFGVGQANAQDENGVVKFSGEKTVAQINQELAAITDYQKIAEIDVTGVTSVINDDVIVSPNPNAIIIVKKNADVANKVNVLPLKEKWVGMDKLVITDGYDFNCTRAFDALSAEYHRYNVKNEYNTLCLPFCINVKDYPENYHFEYLSGILEDGTLEFTRLTSSRNTAVDQKYEGHLSNGTPCILHLHDFDPEVTNNIDIVTKRAVSVNQNEPKSYPMLEDMKLVGSFKYQTLTEEAPVYYIQDNMFWAFGDFDETEVIVPAYRCLIELNNPDSPTPYSKKYNVVSVDDATGVRTVISSIDETPAFNLQGLRVAADTKGIVVKNGKKYFNK